MKILQPFKFAPEAHLFPLMDSLEPFYALKKKQKPADLKEQMRKKLAELLGDEPQKVAPLLRITARKKTIQFEETRFIFTSEKNVDVPCVLRIPRMGRKNYPLMVCLQGHSPGMHLSLGEVKTAEDRKWVTTRDYACQVVPMGFAALCIEQRCFGQRKDMRKREAAFAWQTCSHASALSLILGRTVLGGRVWDVSRALDVVAKFKEIDMDRISCVGDSGGGTVTWYAACMDERIKMAIPACSFSSFKRSIGRLDHCIDNYLPGLLKWMDMADMAVMLAPRPLVIVAGKKDPIFPVDSVVKEFEKVKRIYAMTGAKDKCKLVIGNEGHQFYPDQAWASLCSLSEWC